MELSEGEYDAMGLDVFIGGRVNKALGTQKVSQFYEQRTLGFTSVELMAFLPGINYCGMAPVLFHPTNRSIAGES